MITISQKGNCSGCYACVSVCPVQCITLECDDEGFWYPKTDASRCTSCGLCEETCPILHKTEVDNTPIAYASYNKDEAIRMRSSSGGLFTLLAEHVINNGGVVFGARFNKEFQVVHDYAKTKEMLECFRGSKYVQSLIGDSYKKVQEFLQRGRTVLFTGTPCQIGGLKAYLQKDYDNLICQDIICHGVPSPKVWERYIQYREVCSGAPLKGITFRRKNESWKRYSVSFTFTNDQEYRQTFDKDLMMTAFLQNLCLRPSCYHCAYKTIHRQSDITLADFWGVEYIHPEMGDDKGTSLIMVNTAKGQALFDAIKDNVEYEQTDLNEALKYNSSAVTSVMEHPKRVQFFHQLDVVRFDKLVRQCCKEHYRVRTKRIPIRIITKFCSLMTGRKA